MDHVTLGKTGLLVSRACMGAGGSSRRKLSCVVGMQGSCGFAAAW